MLRLPLPGCYFPVFFQGQQFGFRDAAHFYYPLYQRVQQEWEAGRIPLWETRGERGDAAPGQPDRGRALPGKVVFALVPYAWGARLTSWPTRPWRSSRCRVDAVVGDELDGVRTQRAGLCVRRAILFQSANVIYLVGAAWLPLGVHAVDRWVRRGRRWALIELAFVLSMQLLGGEPQSAYFLGLAGLGYAAGLAWERVPLADAPPTPRAGWNPGRPRPRWSWQR